MTAQRVVARKITVPAGTLSSAPLSTDVSFDQGTVTRVEIVIPDGHAGLTGLALQQAQQQIIPEDAGTWVISNDETIGWDVSDYLNNGNWQTLAYNTDVFDHSFYLRFLIEVIDTTAQAAAVAQFTAAAPGVAADPAESDPGVSVS